MRRLRLAVAVATLASVVTACGGGGVRTVTTTQTQTQTAPVPALKQPAPVACPTGRSFMGCSAANASTRPRLMLALAPRGAKIVDVSSYQGHPDWAAARASIGGAIAKIGEGIGYLDPDAAFNVAAFKRLHIPWAVYWFERPVGCVAEAKATAARVRALGGVKLVVLDEEVSGLQGYAACEQRYLTATGAKVAVYRSSGNNYDSSAPSDPCWVAAYGPSSPPACSGRVRRAWQFTDGRYGFPTYIPGVGTGDVSINYGLLASLAKPKPKPQPKPQPSPTPRSATLVRWEKGRTASYAVFLRARCASHLATPTCWKFGQRVLYFSAKLVSPGGQRRIHCYGSQAKPNSRLCMVERPYVTRWKAMEATEVHAGRVRLAAHYRNLVHSHLY